MFLSNSGTEANEAAIKICLARKKTDVSSPLIMPSMVVPSALFR
ncbi:acetylornithine aminotransferase [Cutibacterium acnes JCM 18909]|nr:acetylornithine aminotransferase [Cutibacterium acnes JCM 18909]